MHTQNRRELTLKHRLRHWNAGISLTAVCATAIVLNLTPTAFAQCDPPPSSTMVAWYTLDETGGGLSRNLATGNTGVWSSPAPTPVAGKVNLALSFNGLSTYVDTPDSIVTNFGPAGGATCTGGDFSACTGDMSFDAWINAPSYAIQQTIVDKRGPGSTGSPVGYSFFLYGKQLGIQLADGLAGIGYDNYLSPVLNGLTPNVWHHVAATVKRTASPSGVIHWYLDGAAHGTSIPARPGSLVNKVPLRIGANVPSYPGSFFNGAIDELEIFNRVLTTAEVHAIYAAGANGKCRP